MTRGGIAILLALWWSVTAPIQAAERDTVFRPLGAERGLLQSTVNSSLQDSRGFIWVGTQAGLHRFDGYDVQLIRDSGNPAAPGEHMISALAEGADGQLWVGTATAGLARMDLRTLRYSPVPPTALAEVARAQQITSLLYQPGQGLWIASHAGIELLPDGVVVRRPIVAGSGTGTAMGPRFVRGLALTKANEVYAATDLGLVRLLPDGTLTTIVETASLQIEAIVPREGGGLWIKGSGGLYRYEAHQEPVLVAQIRAEAASAVVISNLVADAQGGIWYGISGHGLLRLDSRTGGSRWYRAERGVPGALPIDNVTSLMLDRSGLLWIGTEYSGMWYAPSEGSRFGLVVDAANVDRGVRGNNVRALVADGDAIWVGTEGAGLKRYHRSSRSFEDMNAPLLKALAAEGVPAPRELRVYGLRHGRNGHLWVASSHGIFRIRRDSGEARLWPLRQHLPASSLQSFMRTVLETDSGDLWFGSQVHGLVQFVSGTDAVIRHASDAAREGSLSNNLVLVTEQDQEGRLWVGTLDGLNLYRPESGDWWHFRMEQDNPHSLPSSIVRALHTARDGSLWVGTHGGLARLDRLESGRARFTRFGPAETWPDPTVYAIEEDANGRLWLAGNRGLVLFDPASAEFRTFGPEDGLQGYEFNGASSTSLESGELAFGGVGGFNLFRGETIVPSEYSVPVALTRLAIDGMPLALDQSSALQVEPGQRLLGFEFAALDFRAPDRNRYSYRLVGFDDRWLEGRGLGRGSYTNLAPGEYRLQLRGSNSDGVWGETLEIPISVLPPWWASRQAHAIYVLLGVLSVLFAWWLVRNRARQRKAYVDAMRQREDRLKLSLWGSGDGFWDWDIDSDSIHREGLDRVLGHPDSSQVMDLANWKTGEVHPDDLPLVNARMQRHLSGETDYYESEHRLRNAKGQWVWVLARGKVAEREASGQPRRVAGTVRNIEAQRRQQHDARVASEVIRNMTEAVAVLDQDLCFRQVNPAFEAASGYRADGLIGKPWSLLYSPLHGPNFYQAREQALNSSGRWHGECWQRGKDGGDLLFATEAVQARDRETEAPYFVVVQNDITARKRTELELRYLANYDPLTGLANRTLLMQQIGLALPSARAQGRRLAMLFMDLDRFKQINDSLGHAAGDELLRAVGERMRIRLPANAFLARQGGDEFTILLDGLHDIEQAEEVASALLVAFAEPISVRGSEVQVTPSIGIALFPDHAGKPEDLLRFADAAMYAAKAAGRNTFRVYQHAMASHSRLRIALEQSARRVEDLNDFHLVYQPIYRIEDRKPVAVEALLRWSHPELGVVGPDVFVPLLEESGQIVNVGRHALRWALRQLADWRRRGLPDLRVAVNLSTLQLLRAELPMEIRQVLSEVGLSGDALELELTETLLMSNPEQAIRTLTELKAVGVAIAVDDFGTGYSSLSYLKRLPIDKLKIDREFIADLSDDPDDATIVQMIIAMAQALKIRATAEGVETEEQLKFLSQHRCEEAQGFLLCRPLLANACYDVLVGANASHHAHA